MQLALELAALVFLGVYKKIALAVIVLLGSIITVSLHFSFGFFLALELYLEFAVLVTTGYFKKPKSLSAGIYQLLEVHRFTLGSGDQQQFIHALLI